jgi:acyl transferase domain-containing protein
MSEARPEDHGGGEIAICGMAGRFPGAPDVECLWRNLCEGVESITRFSEEDLLRAGEDPATLADPAYVRARPILEDVQGFDASLFGFSPREAEILGPQQRLFLECAWEALEDSGCDPERYPGAIGLFAGASFSSYLVRNLYANRPVLDAFGDVQATILNVPDSLATLTGFKLGLRGPCLAVQTFCSTSLVAVHLACQSLLNYESDAALAGGSSVYVPQRSGYLYQEGGIVSPDGYCRAFDARAGGTVFGSGVGVVVLKRLPDALADRDRVRAVIRGSAVNNDGSLKASYAAPGVAGQAKVVVEALAAAGVSADSIGYVEMHGTGTLLGDPVEVSALTKAFRRTTSRRAFCAIGSVKTNVGHLDAAAGVTALIKSALCVERGKIPPSLHFDTPNPQIDFTGSPFFVNTALRDWDTGASSRRAGVSAFGVGGTNAHVVLEEAPPAPPAEAGRGAQLLVLSAKTGPALDQAALRLAARLREQTGAALADVAWTLQVGRRALDHRWAAVCTTVAEAVSLLEGAEPGRVRRGAPGRSRPRIAFSFPSGPRPGPGAGRALYESEALFREALALCAAAARAWLSADLLAMLYPRPEAVEDAVRSLREQGAGEAALFALAYAQARLWQGWGVEPDVVAGRGVGDLVTACLREELSLEVAVRRAVDRARAAGLPSKGSMEKPQVPEGTVALLLGSEPGDPAQALDMLGGLWVAGLRPDWAGVHAPARPRRVALPTYPFERQRYWVEPEEEGTAPPPSPPDQAVDVRSWLYQAVWKTSLLSWREQASPGGRWLVFADEGGIGDALAARLAVTADQVITVTPGSGFEGDPQAGYRIRPSAGADYAALVEDLRRRDALPAHVVHLWSADPLDGPVDPLAAASERGFYSLLYLLQALGCPPGAGKIELVVVSSGLHDVTGSEPLCPEKAPLLALCVVAPQEYHELACRSVDVDPGAGEPAALAEVLGGELASGARDTVVAYRGGKRWTRTVERVPPRSGAAPLPAVRPGGAYLVTGGLGNLGFLIALAIARAGGGVKLALLSRSALPEREGWDGWLQAHAAADPVGLRIRRVRALEAEGAEVLSLVADVAEEDGLRRALGEGRAQLGPILGVVHAAGLLGGEDFGPLQDLSRETCERVLRAKVQGLVNLSRALAEPAPEFWLLASSLSAVLGGVGYGAYAAGNVFLDHFALERGRRRRGRWLSVGFDRWDFGGRSGREGTGRDEALPRSIGAREGYRLVEHLLRADFGGSVVVSTAPLADRLARWVGLEERPAGTALAAAASSLRARPDLPTAYVAPRDAHEREVVAFFEALLGVGPIGVSDDFFALGGHSLFAARALSRLRTTFGVSLPLEVFFEAPTAAALAARITAALAAREEAGDAAERAGEGRVEIEL